MFVGLQAQNKRTGNSMIQILNIKKNTKKHFGNGRVS